MALPLEALPSAGAPPRVDVEAPAPRTGAGEPDLTLEVLMRQALAVPGAASALLEAFAAQSRALRLIQEADARGAASLPSELRHRLAAAAARTPVWLATDATGVRG
ncbi:MAG: hypothetical protein U5K74_07655 [Gemmatimonadaceae bacterium]|nr:hypothetical protein [Gemmatimonadaceae bacterium]